MVKAIPGTLNLVTEVALLNQSESNPILVVSKVLSLPNSESKHIKKLCNFDV